MLSSISIEFTEAETILIRNALCEAAGDWVTHAAELREVPDKLEASDRINSDADAAFALIDKIEAFLPEKFRTPAWVKTGQPPYDF